MPSLYNPSFCSDLTNTDFTRFFLKLSHLLKFIWYLDCTGSFHGCYEVEKRIDNSVKFLDLDGNILMSVLLKLLDILICYFNTR